MATYMNRRRKYCRFTAEGATEIDFKDSCNVKSLCF